MARYLPIALNVESRTCLVVGGGPVAARRALLLFEAGAAVRVVAPELCEEMNRLAIEAVVSAVQEPYRAEHLDGAVLAVACTNSSDVNHQIVTDCRERGILVGNAESGEAGDFVVPSVIRRGDLHISVTTGGASPWLTSKIAAELETQYGAEYLIYTAILDEMRWQAKTTIASASERRDKLRKLADDETILQMIRDGDMTAARERALKCISSSPD